MSLRPYLELMQMLETGRLSAEDNRAFGLAHAGMSPLAQLRAWVDAHRDRLDHPDWGEAYARWHYRSGLILGVLAFLAGLFSGAALLSYSGRAPVNVVYYLALAVGIPLLTMGLAILSMLRAGHAHNALVHLSPASWLSGLLALLPFQMQEKVQNIRFHPRLANWLVIERSQMMAWWFAVGLLLALIGIVVTQDVAFAWSTTLSVTPEAFHRLTEWIALPWRAWLPDAVPSLDLIAQSQYFRLGGKLDAEMVHHAADLGAWWRFLAMATAVYAVGLRLLMWLAARLGLRRATDQAILALEGVSQVLTEMNTPIVHTASPEEEARFTPGSGHYPYVTAALDPFYDHALGWAMEAETIRVILDGLEVEAEHIADPGGSRTLDEDAAILDQTQGSVLLLVKAWEPPTMDGLDFVEALMGVAERITIAPIGTPDSAYRAEPDDRAIWSRKLKTIANPKVVLWQP